MFARSSRVLFSKPNLFASSQKSFLAANRYMGAVVEVSPEEVTERVLETIRNYEKIDPTKVNKTAHFVKDLGLDSLDAVEVVMALEDEFCIEIPEETACGIASIPDAVSCIVNHPHKH
uniref:Acyl carrier protein n=1 Tax=Vannella robusta TaxID=1487602 RepID=A0A7S4M6L0_9EUKA|mmetsp:Transcript_12967/g.16227  ORF Transcript_12967/g.16227 Transcript_12967/m.16227 type:complete len:118 (+) Transcript_12967:51-404(+)